MQTIVVSSPRRVMLTHFAKEAPKKKSTSIYRYANSQMSSLINVIYYALSLKMIKVENSFKLLRIRGTWKIVCLRLLSTHNWSITGKVAYTITLHARKIWWALYTSDFILSVRLINTIVNLLRINGIDFSNGLSRNVSFSMLEFISPSISCFILVL